MRIQVSVRCVADCGVRAQGELDTDKREFIHRFSLPAGVDALLEPKATEVAGSHLATFSPEAADWRIECPVCRRSILVREGPALRA
jgi:hypothetical protein